MELEILGHQIVLSRTFRTTGIGLVLGFLISFKSETLLQVILGTFGIAYLLGIAGLFTENTSKLKATGLVLAFATPLILFQLIIPTQACYSHAHPGYELKENKFTGEIRSNEFIGDRNCADLLPWYYEKLDNESDARNEFKRYCADDNDSRVCQMGIEFAMEDAGYS